MKGTDVAHVTIKLIKGLPSLRSTEASEVILEGIRRVNEKGVVRIVHYSIQSNHVHMLVEAENSADLSKGMASLNTGLGMRLNRLFDRVGEGSVFQQRFHMVVISTPAQMKNALLYVLKNHEHHVGKRRPGSKLFDPYSSASTFPFWRGYTASESSEGPTVEPRTWLLTRGWSKAKGVRGGRLSLHSLPSLQA